MSSIKYSRPLFKYITVSLKMSYFPSTPVSSPVTEYIISSNTGSRVQSFLLFRSIKWFVTALSGLFFLYNIIKLVLSTKTTPKESL